MLKLYAPVVNLADGWLVDQRGAFGGLAQAEPLLDAVGFGRNRRIRLSIDGSGGGSCLIAPVLADPPTGRLEDLPVDDQDDGQRHVEGGARGENLIGNVLADHATLFDVDPFQELCVFPAEERRQRQGQCHGPHQEDHRADPLSVPVVDVVHVRHCPVPEIQITKEFNSRTVHCCPFRESKNPTSARHVMGYFRLINCNRSATSGQAGLTSGGIIGPIDTKIMLRPVSQAVREYANAVRSPIIQPKIK